MPGATMPSLRRSTLFSALLLSGAGGLTWELLWQHHVALALGVSAHGAAITLASLMAGFALGGLLAPLLARRGLLERPLRVYGIAELVVAGGGLLVPAGLRALSLLDARVYSWSPRFALLLQVLGIGALLIVPATAMGITIPILAPCARMARTSLARLYAINTLGAMLGVLLVTFVLLPLLGVFRTSLVAAAVDLAVAVWAIRAAQTAPPSPPEDSAGRPPPMAMALAFLSGLAIFTLEISWFRSIRAAYQATTETFAILLTAFLLPMAVGSWLASIVRRRHPGVLRHVPPFAAAAVLCASPWIDQLDRFHLLGGDATSQVVRFSAVLSIVFVPVALLGALFPWLLEDQGSTSGCGRLYAINTLGAVSGSLLGAFVLLPAIGATRATWLTAGALLLFSFLAQRRLRVFLEVSALGVLGLGIAVHFDTGPGRKRIQGFNSGDWGWPLYVAEGPDATVAVVDDRDGHRLLVIDGFAASEQSEGSHYMAWMGHLPALAAAELRNALVICFGTGQTAHAVRRHRPGSLDIVDLSPAVLRAAPLFKKNEDVLRDPVAHPVVMDGRAFLRRSRRSYDVITMEPMPPSFAGVNSLYSREFYDLVRAHLAPGGVAAQWVPLHLLAPDHLMAVLATFVAAFPHARLWIDPVTTNNAILVGGALPWRTHPSPIALDLSDRAIWERFLLDETHLRLLADAARSITDDNQLLSYGWDRIHRLRYTPQLPRISLRFLLELRKAGQAGAPGEVSTPP